ncbi:DUF4198 domain-containing protein [Leucothrix sargassi]|nr:DUF4198 domain-containing protein [Leucothrix sargassi]
MFNKILLKNLCLAWVFAAFASVSVSATAHEFWIEPLSFELAEGENIQAHIKVGQELSGDSYAFFPANFDRFDLTVNGKKSPLRYRFAQKPAVDEPTKTDGLHILTYQSRSSALVYETPEKFASFLKAEGLDWVFEEHKKRGLPEAGFTELFKRFAKSLIKVGEGAGQDSQVGLRFEWVLLDNPYTDPDLKTVSAQLFFEEKPFADSTVNVFIKQGDKVEQRQLKTDDDGKVTMSVEGGGMFLVNAVHMVIPDATVEGVKDAAWLSLWASTTFNID